METAYEIWNTMEQGQAGENTLQENPVVKFIRRCARPVQKEKKRNIRCFVMHEKDAANYRICERNIQIEIRDGFNSNLVVQHYEEKHRMIIYIPQGWKKRIIVDINGGTVLCRQRELCEGLRLNVKKGNIIYGQEGSV